MLRRLLGPKKSLPRDPYAVPESPVKPIVNMTQPEEPAPAFSPRRGDKQRQPNGGKATQKSKALEVLKERRTSRRRLTVPDTEVEKQQSPEASPRRSPRKHASDVVASGTSSSGEAVRSTRPTSARQDVAAEKVEMHDTNSNDDALVFNEHVGGLEEEEEVDVAARNHAPPQTPQKRGRGRPPKKKKGPRPPLKEKAPTSPSRSGGQVTMLGNATNEHASVHDLSNSTQAGEKVDSMIRPIIPRRSEIPFSNDASRDALEDTLADEEAGAQQERTRKRKAPSSSSQDATNAKKQAKLLPAYRTNVRKQPEQNEHESQEVGESVDEAEETDKLRLFGQGWRLEKIYKKLNKVGLSRRNGQDHRANIDRNDQDVRAIHRLCKQAKKSLQQVENREEDGQSLADPPEQFQEIELGVQRLCTSNEKDEEKAGEIYFHTIPVLVKLLKDTVETYEKIDASDSESSTVDTITIDHLGTVMDLIAVILKMGAGANEYNRPNSNFAVVRPVKYDILRPLKEVYFGFLDYLDQLKRDQARARRQAIQSAQMAQEERREQMEREGREHEDQLRKSWQDLHDERRYVEPFGPLEKLWHLRMPDPPIECDQNDEQYVRVELFKRRIGPHPVYVKKTLDQVWSEEEIDALEHGLREFAGPRVFQRIFRTHCGRKGALSRYNVTEIVTTAADMKEHLAAEQMEEYGEVEDWVKQIPVWVKIPTLSGQENNDSAQ